MKTNKDADFINGDDDNINNIKKIIIRLFDRYKDYWLTISPEWDYEIKEFLCDGCFQIEIWCGLTKICIVKEKDLGFYKIGTEQFRTWEKVMMVIGISGIVPLYKNKIRRIIEEGIDGKVVDYKQYPLTIREVYQNNTNIPEV